LFFGRIPDLSPLSLSPDQIEELAMTEGIMEYIPGDRVSFELTFTHKMNIEDVVARFVYEGAPGTTNYPEVLMRRRGPLYTEWEHGIGHTRVTLESEDRVPLAVAPGGEYRLESVFVKTFAGQSHPLTGLPHVRCRILRGEPAELPECKNISWT
jgi:hypothetical protein